MVVELGRLVYDVKVEQRGAKNTPVLNNRLAILQGKDGNGGEKTTFIDVVAWSGTAELIAKYLKKGNEIYVEGHLENTMKKKENVDYQTVVLYIESIKFTQGNKRDEEPPFLG